MDDSCRYETRLESYNHHLGLSPSFVSFIECPFINAGSRSCKFGNLDIDAVIFPNTFVNKLKQMAKVQGN